MMSRDPERRGRRDYDQPEQPKYRHPVVAVGAKLWALPAIKELLVAGATVWIAMGGTFQTPAVTLMKHINAESAINAGQDSALSLLKISLANEVTARRAITRCSRSGKAQRAEGRV